jgi:transposase
VHEVARIFNIPQRTVFNWLARYRSGGWDGLKEGSRRGRPRKQGYRINELLNTDKLLQS